MCFEAETAIPVLAELLKDKEPSVRCAAVCTLDHILGVSGPKGKVAVPALIDALKSNDTYLKCAARPC